MAELYSTRIAVRIYELDNNNHLNQAVYLQYAEHAFSEHIRAAGVSRDRLLAAGVGPVYLEYTIKFYSELHAEDEVDVICEFIWGSGKTFEVRQRIVRENELAAEMFGIAGVIDMHTRKLLANPAECFRSLATKPELLSL